jgi:hypothetical protein
MILRASPRDAIDREAATIPTLPCGVTERTCRRLEALAEAIHILVLKRNSGMEFAIEIFVVLLQNQIVDNYTILYGSELE